MKKAAKLLFKKTRSRQLQASVLVDKILRKNPAGLVGVGRYQVRTIRRREGRFLVLFVNKKNQKHFVN